MGECWRLLWLVGVDVQVVAVVMLLDEVVVMGIGIMYVAVLVMRRLLRNMDQHVLLSSFPAPLKTRAAAALVEYPHPVGDWFVALDVVVVVWAVSVATILYLETTVYGCVVSFWDVVAVGVVHITVLLPLFDLPLRVNL